MFLRRPQTPQEVSQNDQGLPRVFNFSDGVFSIAVTLLVLNLKMPELHHASEAQVADELLNLIGPFSIYLFSFLVVGVHWVMHHRVFGFIVRYDRKLLWRNMYYLLTISFLPFPVNFLSQYGDSAVATCFFAECFAATHLTMYALWRHASHQHRLLREDTPRSAISYNLWISLGNFLLFSISGLLAFFNPTVAKALWALTIFLPSSIGYFSNKSRSHA